MQPDFSQLVQQAAQRCWETQSFDQAVEILRPALAARSVEAYRYLVDFLIGLGRMEEAKGYAEILLREARTNLDLVIVCQMCRNRTFSMLAFDESSIYQKTLFTLADQGNPVIQTEIALNYLRGESGFQRDAKKFEHWIQAAIQASEEIDPVCHFVEHLLDTGQPIEIRLLERLKIAIEAEPELSEVQSLYKRAQR